MGEMSMNRAIHAGFRRDLDRLDAALSAFPAGNQVRATQLDRAWANLDDQFTYHHHGEHEIAWPALRAVGVSADLLAELDGEHAALETALVDVRAAMAGLARTALADDAKAALAAVERLREVAVTHLDHEEAELEPVFLAKRDSPELKAMGKQFAKVSPARAGRYFAWLLDGADDDVRAAVTHQIPGPVVSVVSGVFGRSYRRDVAPAWES